MFAIRQITEIGKAYRNIKRYKEILHILFKYGFGGLLKTLRLEHMLEKITRHHTHAEEYSWPEKVRLALEELGPTFVKLGQILSTRPDLVPLGFAEELSSLQDNVPPFPYEKAREIIREEFGGYPEDIFLEFDEKPLAAASIGQVHHARLKDGSEVVVKIRRPGIEKTIEIDLEIMHYLARLMETHLKEIEVHKPSAIVEEFARSLEKEIDLKNESYNMTRFKNFSKNDPTVKCPEIFSEFTTGKILTMECIKGIKLSEIDKLEKNGYDLKAIAANGAETVMKQIFDYGFFHADPHPGNIYIMPGNVICFLDFGIIGRVSQREKDNFASLIMSVIRRDEKAASRKIRLLTRYEDEPDDYLFQRDIGDIIEQHLDRPLKDLDFGKFLERILELMTRYRLRLRPNLFLMIKAVISVEKAGKNLDPELDIIKYAKPHIKKIMLNRFNPRKILRNLADPANEMFQLINDLPEDISAIIKKTKKGELKIEFEHQGLAPLLKTITAVSSNIAFSIVLAALIVGSALITLSGIPPKIYDIPVIGLLGSILSGIMGFWLLLSLIKNGRIK